MRARLVQAYFALPLSLGLYASEDEQLHVRRRQVEIAEAVRIIDERAMPLAAVVVMLA